MAVIYKDSKAILPLLEQALMGIGTGHTLLSVNTLFNDVSLICKSIDMINQLISIV